MSFDLDRIYGLLPAFYRIRDAEQGYALKGLLSVIAEQVAVLEEDLNQLYDNQFIETCAEWVVPYIGDLVGARGLFVFKNATFSQRALVANTLKDRRRKGTASSIQELAQGVTQWNATVVEFFQELATSQYMNHIRVANVVMPDLRNGDALESIGTPFDSSARTFEARRIATNRGKYNISNIGIFLWRVTAYPLTDAFPASAGPSQFKFDPLGLDRVLYIRPEDHPAKVTQALTRRMFAANLKRSVEEGVDGYYGVGKSLSIRVDGVDVPVSEVRSCNLSDVSAGGWAQSATDKYLIDPVLGRLMTPSTLSAGAQVRVSWHYGFTDELGGGEYSRENTFTLTSTPVTVTSPSSLQTALTSLTGAGVVEIGDDATYSGAISIDSASSADIELRARDRNRPVLNLVGDAMLRGGVESSITLNGLVIAGGSLRVPAAGNHLRTLRIRHCTILPASESALVVESPDIVTIEIESSILGGIRCVQGAQVKIINSIVDTGDEERVAYAGLNGQEPGAAFEVTNSTIIGKVWTLEMDLASNSIFLARLGDFDFWNAPVDTDRLQQGCIRFSYVPPGSRVPRRYHCQPSNDMSDPEVRPVFTSRRYGDAGYYQLDTRCSPLIQEGADDGAEMGAFHDLYQPQRIANLRARLDEYLRFSLEAGIFKAS